MIDLDELARRVQRQVPGVTVERIADLVRCDARTLAGFRCERAATATLVIAAGPVGLCPTHMAVYKRGADVWIVASTTPTDQTAEGAGG